MLSFERRALPSVYARLSSFLIPTTLVINNGHNGDSNNQYKTDLQCRDHHNGTVNAEHPRLPERYKLSASV